MVVWSAKWAGIILWNHVWKSSGYLCLSAWSARSVLQNRVSTWASVISFKPHSCLDSCFWKGLIGFLPPTFLCLIRATKMTHPGGVCFPTDWFKININMLLTLIKGYPCKTPFITPSDRSFIIMKAPSVYVWKYSSLWKKKPVMIVTENFNVNQ